MSATSEVDYAFKFHFLNEKGHATTVFRKKGSFDGQKLTLATQEIPIEHLVQTVVREQTLVLVYYGESGLNTLLITPSSKKIARDLKNRLDISRSATVAKIHREDLTKQGRVSAFRQEICPHCTATLILTDMPVTPQLYCHFCDTLSTIDPAFDAIPNEKEFRLCEECGMFSQPKHYTIFYFYFLLVVYGYWAKTTWRCPGCMRREAWKMFFGNFLFVLGVPVAIFQLARTYSGSVIGGAFRGLDTANLCARKGDFPNALLGYRKILENVPFSAGIKYNLGLSLLNQGEERHAAEALELALKDCANYTPAYSVLQQIYTKLGETEKCQQLRRMWQEESDPKMNTGT